MPKIKILNVSYDLLTYKKKIKQFIKVLGIFKEKRKDLEFFMIRVGINTLVNGKTINSMEKED